MTTQEYDRIREAVEFGVRLGLPALATNAMIAMVQRDYVEAARLIAGDPHAGQDHIVDAGKMVKSTPVVAESTTTPQPKRAAKPKRYAEPRTKPCAQCGEDRGVTAFPRGEDVCRRCLKTKGGKIQDPGIKIVRCKHCGRGAPESQINPDGLCLRCTGRAA